MNLDRRKLAQAIRHVFAVVDSYKSTGAPRNEQRLDPVLYGFFLARGLSVERQVRTVVGGRKMRIDFALGGNNPAFLEWAVRPPSGGPALGARLNAAELRKLSRKKNARRYLLLVDLTKARLRLGLEKLRQEYAAVKVLGPGKFPRNSVTVVYAHHADEVPDDLDGHCFRWDP